MVAPLDAKVTFEVEGEPITLRLNFRSIALAEEHGIDLLAEEEFELTKAKSAQLLKCLMAEAHPEYTEDHAMAIVVRAPGKVRDSLVELFTKYGGIAGGNARGRKAKLKNVA